MNNNPYTEFSFEEFAKFLEKYNDLNSAPIDNEDRLFFLRALLKKVGILDREIWPTALDLAPPHCQLTDEGLIYIEKLRKTLIKKENSLVGEYITITIDPDWKFVRGTLSYRVPCSILPT